MPSYAWRCLACGVANEPTTGSCANCGCPASPTSAQIDSFHDRAAALGQPIEAATAAANLKPEVPGSYLLLPFINLLFGVPPFKEGPYLAIWSLVAVVATVALLGFCAHT
jgi:hypothetical protein